MPNYLPCLNPSCKSHGQSHPGCKCYADVDTSTLQGLESQGYELPSPAYHGGRRKTGALTDTHPRSWAEGGEIEHYCSEDRPHKPDCPYYKYAYGDIVPADDLPSTDNTPQPTNNNLVPANDLPEGIQATNKDIPVPENDLPPSPLEQYSTPGQQLLAGVEGTAQGLAGPLATAGELGLSKLGVPGLSAEDIAGRTEANPWIHGLAETGALAGSMLVPGLGEYNLVTKAIKPVVKAAEALPIASKLGAAAIKGAIETGMFQASDEGSKYLLGTGGNIDDVMNSITSAGILGLIAGGSFNILGRGANKLVEFSDKKLSNKAHSWAAGIGLKDAPIAPEFSNQVEKDIWIDSLSPSQKELYELKESFFEPQDPSAELKIDMQAFKNGLDFDKNINELSDSASKSIAKAAGAGISGLTGGGILGYEFLEQTLDPIIQKNIARPIMKNWVAPAILNALSSDYGKNLGKVIRFMEAAGKQSSNINNGVEAIFKAGTPYINPYSSEKDKDKVKEYIENGGVNQDLQDYRGSQTLPTFAEGGQVDSSIQPVQTHPIVDQYPALGMGLSEAKGRISNYLNSQRPQTNPTKLPFDSAPPTTQQERTYNRALDIAIQPLGILNHIKEGTLTSEHVQHMNAMYPELTQHLQKKITERILTTQLEGEKPAYKIRQAMSLFMNSPMDSSFTPASLQAAQGVFAQQQATMAPPQAQKAKKGTAPLSKMSANVNTPEQARQQRANKT